MPGRIGPTTGLYPSQRHKHLYARVGLCRVRRSTTLRRASPHLGQREQGDASRDDDDGPLRPLGEPPRDRAEDPPDDALRGADDDRVRLVLPADLLELVADVAAALDEDPRHLGEVVR